MEKKSKFRAVKNTMSKALMMIVLIFFGGWAQAQLNPDQFLWTNGSGDGQWTNPANWLKLPYGSSTGVSTPFYPGSNSGANPNGNRNDVAIFTSVSTGGACLINKPSGESGGLRIGGMLVLNYEGDLIQTTNNRLIVAECVSPSGDGTWDSLGVISTFYGGLNPADSLNGRKAYQALFQFSSGGFYGNPSDGPGLVYSNLFAVPVTIRSGVFKAPKKELYFRHDVYVADGSDFDAITNMGTVLLSNRGGENNRYYDFGGVNFYNLKVASDAVGPPTKNFYGGSFNVSNDLIIGAIHGNPGAGGQMVLNGTDAEMNVKGNIILLNNSLLPSYTEQFAAGNLLIRLNGLIDQTIIHSNINDLTGNVPFLEINKPSGNVYLDGPVTVTGGINFRNGIVFPLDASTNQNDITSVNDLFVLNSNATVVGMSDSSYCNGPIRCRTGKTIELPLGKNGQYRPAIINNISGLSIDYSSSNTYTAEYFDEEAMMDITAMVDSLISVSSCEVWAIHKHNTDDALIMNLEPSFDVDNCEVGLSCNTVVTRYSSSEGMWLSHGGVGPGTTSHGDFTMTTEIHVLTSDFERGAMDMPDLFTFATTINQDCDTCSINSLCVNYCSVNGVFTFNPVLDIGDGTTITGYRWDFGDGITSSEPNPEYVFGEFGLQTINVVVWATSDPLDTCFSTYTFYIFNNECEVQQDNPNQRTKRGGSDEQLQGKELKEYENITNSELSLFPNPTTGFVNINILTSTSETLDYTIVDIKGTVVMSGVLFPNRNEQLDVSSLVPGMYLVKVNDATKKLIIQ